MVNNSQEDYLYTVKEKGIKEWKSRGKIAYNIIVTFYILIALEFLFMISPFAIYYYAVYSFILNKLFTYPLTNWLTAFFLPHIVLVNDPFLVILTLAGPIFFLLGLFIFLVSAVQVYYAKLKKRSTVLVTNGFYSFIRHSQYLGLTVSGLGILLMWPRFFILVIYITMLFIYYLLAKNEEKEMERRFGDVYKNYRLRTSMFLPGLKTFFSVSGSGLKRGLVLLILYLVLLLGGIGVGFLLREYTKSQLPILYLKDIAVVPLIPSDKVKSEEIIERILVDERVVSYLSKFKPAGQKSYIVYIMPIDSELQDLTTDDDMTAYKGNNTKQPKSNFVFRIRNLHDMFILGPLSRLDTRRVTEMRRVIFCRVFDSKDRYISTKEVLGIRVKRIPILFVDINIKEWKIDYLVETPVWRRKDIIPMPIF